MTAPSDYEDAGESVAVEDVSNFADLADYESAKPPPRPPMLRGTPRLCHCCYKTDVRFIDTVCPGCIATLHLLSNLRVEIGKTVPAAMTMTLPALFEGLWKGYQRLKKAS